MRFCFYIDQEGLADKVSKAVRTVAEACAENDLQIHGRQLAGPMNEDEVQEAFDAYKSTLHGSHVWHEPLSGYIGVQSSILVVRTPGDGCAIYYQGRTIAFEASVRTALGQNCPGEVPGLVDALKAAGITNLVELRNASHYYDGEAYENAAYAGGSLDPWRKSSANRSTAARVAAGWAESGSLSKLASMCWEARHVLLDLNPGEVPIYKAREILKSWPSEAREALARAIGIPECGDEGRKWTLLEVQ